MNTETSEHEMRQVFDNALSAISTLRDKTISTVVAHSDTARQLNELRERFDELSQRMNSVVQEAQRFRQDLHLTMVERDKYKQEAMDNASLAEGYSKERDEARQQLSETRANLTQSGMELADAQRNVQALTGQVDRYRADVEWSQRTASQYREERDEARSNLDKVGQELKQAQDRLSRLQGLMRELFPEAPKPSFEEVHKEVESFRPSPIVDLAQPSEDKPTSGEVQSSSESQPVNEPSEDKPTEETKPTPWWDRKAEF
jgi:chromosome segregation ATPase